MKNTHRTERELPIGQQAMLPVIEKDLEHFDALFLIRDRFFGLRCAIHGADIARIEDRSGLQQLAADLIETFNELCSTFAEERGLKV